MLLKCLRPQFGVVLSLRLYWNHTSKLSLLGSEFFQNVKVFFTLFKGKAHFPILVKRK